jgi:hypothetical protein
MRKNPRTFEEILADIESNLNNGVGGPRASHISFCVHEMIARHQQIVATMQIDQQNQECWDNFINRFQIG